MTDDQYKRAHEIHGEYFRVKERLDSVKKHGVTFRSTSDMLDIQRKDLPDEMHYAAARIIESGLQAKLDSLQVEFDAL
jgi:hypothetical protein